MFPRRRSLSERAETEFEQLRTLDFITTLNRQRQQQSRLRTLLNRLRGRTVTPRLTRVETEMLRPLPPQQREFIEESLREPTQKELNAKRAREIAMKIIIEVPPILRPRADRIRSQIERLLDAIIRGEDIRLESVDAMLSDFEKQLNDPQLGVASPLARTREDVKRGIKFPRFSQRKTRKKTLKKRKSPRRTSQRRIKRKRKSPMKRKNKK